MAAAFSHLVAAALLGLVGSLSIPDTARTLSRAALPQLRARNTRACTYESIRRSLEDDARYQQSLGTANPGPEELQVIVAPAEGKGMGAFAAEPAEKGRWICTYEGELLTLIETEQRYAYEEPAYLFTITPDLYRDANFSTHFSRYFNHDEHGNLDHTVDVAQQRIDFYALRDIAVGEELTFDYGEGYWHGCSAMLAAGTDSRNFSLKTEKYAKPRGPPPVTPRTLDELEKLLYLTSGEARAGYLRALEYFGASRLSSGELEVPLGLPPAERVVVATDTAPLGLLHSAAFNCIVQATQLKMQGCREETRGTPS